MTIGFLARRFTSQFIKSREKFFKARPPIAKDVLKLAGGLLFFQAGAAVIIE